MFLNCFSIYLSIVVYALILFQFSKAKCDISQKLTNVYAKEKI